MDELNPAVRRYIVGLAVAAAAILLPSMVLSARVRSGEQLLYAGLLGAGLLAAHHFPVHLTEKTKVYVDTALLFAAVLLLSPALAIATAASTAAIHELVEHVSWQQGSFNVAQTVLYVAAGAWVFHAIADPGSPPPLTAPRALIAALVGVVVMHVLNTAAVAGAGALQLGRPPVNFWLDGIWVDLPEHVLLVANGMLLAIAAQSYPWLLPLLVGPLVLVYLSLRGRAELRVTTQEMVEALTDLSDLLGSETAGHSRRVADRTRALADRLGLPPGDTDLAVRAARVRGLGVIGANGDIPASGGNIQYDRASRIVAVLPNHGAVAEAVRHVQEQWDGNGGPDGLRGEAIPLPARLVAVADAFERFTGSRKQESPLGTLRAIELMTVGAGREWDPRVVGALTEIVRSEKAVVP